MATVLETEVRKTPIVQLDNVIIYIYILYIMYSYTHKNTYHLYNNNNKSVLITNPNSKHMDIVNLLKHRIEGYITAKKSVMVTYNCNADILEAVCKITPGKRAPTITQLTDGGHAVSGLVKKSDIVKVMDDLHKAGARDILVFELSNSRM